jgi:hypothetical protein
MPFTEDLTEFTDTDDFGTAVTLDGSPVNAIFDREYLEDGQVSGRVPMLKGREADFSGATEGTSTVVINAVTYVVEVIQPDGTGWVEVALRQQ